ncbi:hypothetical protein ACIHDR_46870 [Nocardia sp. NPDC052278]|uniref:hypothetical protein n=1 Tax=unclassified Nocardia TaxID=2637762 RepID=UPI0036A01613
MDPLTIIVTALIAGAATGGRDAASAVVRDGYTAVRDRIFRGGADSETTAAIEANEAAPGSNVAEIEAALTRRRLVDDSELLSAAAELLARLPSDRVERAGSRIDLSHAQGVQIGDHTTQHNTFR